MALEGEAGHTAGLTFPWEARECAVGRAERVGAVHALCNHSMLIWAGSCSLVVVLSAEKKS